MKNGDHTDNWGDFAEIDYIKIKGNNENIILMILIYMEQDRPNIA